MPEQTTPPHANGNVVNLRLDNLEKSCDRRDSRIKELEDDVAELREIVARLSERLTLFQIFQASLSGILSTVAAIFGKIP